MTPTASSVTAHPVGNQNFAIVTCRDSHLVVGAPQLHTTYSQRSQPIDLLLAALATDCTFVCQQAARSLNILLNSMNTTVSWAADERSHAEVSALANRVIYVRMALSGPTQAQAAALMAAVRDECSTYLILSSSLTIELEAVA